MIFVTGGTGLLGARLICDLVRSGNTVRALKRETSNLGVIRNILESTGDLNELWEQIEWVNGDVLDYFSLIEAMEGVEDVYHCAAMVSFHPRARDKMMKVNVEGTANVVNACLEKKVRKLCFASSVAAIGDVPSGQFITEDAEWKTNAGKSNYAISKYASEQEVWRGAEEGLNMVIVNPTIIVGPGDWKRSSARMFLDSYRGMKYYTTGGNGFVDVDDVSGLMIALMKSDISYERFLVNGENLSYKNAFSLIARAFNKPIPTKKVTPKMMEVVWRLDKLRSMITGSRLAISKEIARESSKIQKYSNKKIKEAIGFEFTPISESISKTTKVFLGQKS